MLLYSVSSSQSAACPAATAMLIVECVALSIMVSVRFVIRWCCRSVAKSPSPAKGFCRFLLGFAVKRASPHGDGVFSTIWRWATPKWSRSAGCLRAIAQLAPRSSAPVLGGGATGAVRHGGQAVVFAVCSNPVSAELPGGTTAGLQLLQHGPIRHRGSLRPQALFVAPILPRASARRSFVAFSQPVDLHRAVACTRAVSIERLQVRTFWGRTC